jgi:2-haloacid dehalogenase
MSKILGFDVYGTLVNTAAIETPLRELMGDLAGVFAARWREKQLEYSFRRGLMQHYADFSVCTRQALDYCVRPWRSPFPVSSVAR